MGSERFEPRTAKSRNSHQKIVKEKRGLNSQDGMGNSCPEANGLCLDAVLTLANGNYTRSAGIRIGR